jgi:hypothetical protein
VTISGRQSHFIRFHVLVAFSTARDGVWKWRILLNQQPIPVRSAMIQSRGRSVVMMVIDHAYRNGGHRRTIAGGCWNEMGMIASSHGGNKTYDSIGLLLSNGSHNNNNNNNLSTPRRWVHTHHDSRTTIHQHPSDDHHEPPQQHQPPEPLVSSATTDRNSEPVQESRNLRIMTYGQARQFHQWYNDDQTQTPRPASHKFVPKLVVSDSQAERNDRITYFGRYHQWPRLLKIWRLEQNDYSLTNLAATLSQLSKIPKFLARQDKRPLLKLIQSIADHIDAHAIDARSYANICYSIGKLPAVLHVDDAALRIMNHLANVHFVKEFTAMGNAQSIANVCWSLARLRRPDLMQNLLSVMDDAQWCCRNAFVTPRDPATILVACAKLDLTFPALLSVLEEHADWFVDNADPQQIATTVWACARLNHPSPALFTAIDARAADWLAEHGKPQEISNTVWACAKLGYQAPTLFKALERIADWFVNEGNPLDVADAVWACATLGHQSPALFAAVEQQQRADWIIATGTAQEIANTAWACATLNHQSPNLFAAMERRSEWLAKNESPHIIADLVWACAKLDHKTPAFFAAVGQRSDWLVEHGSPRDIGRTAWAFATLNHDAHALLAAIETRFEWLVTNGNPQDLAHTVWSFARLDHKSPALFAAVESTRSDWLVTNGAPLDIAMTAWAFARLGHSMPTLLSAITEQWDVLKSKGDQRSVYSLELTFKELGHPLPQ